MVKLEYNNQTENRAPKRKLEAILNTAQKKLKRKGREVISLALVKENEMRKLNKTYRGKNKVTDVLSFEAGEYRQPREASGEIIICPSQARKQAEQYGNSYTREMMKLVLHGYLHILGYDHERESEAEKMEDLEQKILDSI